MMKRLTILVFVLTIESLLCSEMLRTEERINFPLATQGTLSKVNLDEVPVAEDDVLDTDKSFDDIGISGNWIKKRDTLLKANVVGDEIQDFVGIIQKARKKFKEKYDLIDDVLDDFYKNLGIDQGRVRELFDDLSSYLDKEKQKRQENIIGLKESRNISERESILKIEVVEEEVQEHRKKLDQLKLDMKSVEDLDKSLNQRLVRLDEQILHAVKLASNARKNVDKLWSIIDHNKAREIYFELSGDILEKIRGIDEYLNNDLMQDFETVTNSIEIQIKKIGNSVKTLEENGLIIKQRAKKVADLKLKKKLEKELAKKKMDEKKVPVKKSVPKQKTWYEIVYTWIVNLVAKIYQFFIEILTKKK
jgi:hypothetical protein